jgi:hypothetical protein
MINLNILTKIHGIPCTLPVTFTKEQILGCSGGIFDYNGYRVTEIIVNNGLIKNKHLQALIPLKELREILDEKFEKVKLI